MHLNFFIPLLSAFWICYLSKYRSNVYFTNKCNIPLPCSCAHMIGTCVFFHVHIIIKKLVVDDAVFYIRDHRRLIVLGFCLCDLFWNSFISLKTHNSSKDLVLILFRLIYMLRCQIFSKAQQTCVRYYFVYWWYKLFKAMPYLHTCNLWCTWVKNIYIFINA